VYTAIVWLPIRACLIGIGLLLSMGLMQLEIRSEGTEMFIPNGATPDYVNPTVLNQGQEQDQQLAEIDGQQVTLG
jgi:hypothetical protein